MNPLLGLFHRHSKAGGGVSSTPDRAYYGTFPTTPIIDDFNRADQAPPSADWNNFGTIAGVVRSMEIFSGTCRGITLDAGWQGMGYNAAVFQSPCEFYTTFYPNTSDWWIEFDWHNLKITTGSSASIYYSSAIYADGAHSTIDITVNNPVVADRWVSISIPSLTLNQPFQFGVSMSVDGDIYAHLKRPGGEWEHFYGITDTGKNSGYLQIFTYNSATIYNYLDDFGGGSL